MSIESPQHKTLDNQRKYDGKIKFVDNEDAALTVNERTVVAESDTAAVTITLPEVGTAAGKLFTVRAPSGVTNNVTVEDLAGNEVASLTGDGDSAVIYSDGLVYHDIA